jgi:hypothetical protein
MKLFTKRFFRLGHTDQVAVVEAVTRDLENCMGRHRDSKGDRKAEKKIERIQRQAREYGVGDDRAKPRRNDDLPGQMTLWEE